MIGGHSVAAAILFCRGLSAREEQELGGIAACGAWVFSSVSDDRAFSSASDLAHCLDFYSILADLARV